MKKYLNSRSLLVWAPPGLVVLAAGVYLALHVPRGGQASLPPLKIVIRTGKTLLPGANAASIAESMVKAGVRSVWLQCKQDETDRITGGMVFFPSKIAPIAPGFEHDRLGAFIDALNARHIEVRGWMPTLHDAAAARAHPGWRAEVLDETGRAQPQPDWLCPNEPEATQYQAALAAEIAGRYPKLKSVELDFIRYDNDFSCACQRCLAAISRITNTPVDGAAIRAAQSGNLPLWKQWSDFRRERISALVTLIRDRLHAVRPKMSMGAFVLPFFSSPLDPNLYDLARAGLEEIVLVGYWDDWEKTPEWVKEVFEGAIAQVKGASRVSIVLEGGMSVRRTRRTLESLGQIGSEAAYFQPSAWTAADFSRLQKARAGYLREGVMPGAKEICVVIRTDTEPDDNNRYDTLSPGMIDVLLQMFREEEVKTTFITCGKLAELQPDAIRRAAQEGHEIGCHSYDHEQLDALDPKEQLRVVALGLQSLERILGQPVVGFGAPRNSITPTVRDYLIEQKLEYDGSDAYDPAESFLTVDYVSHTRDPRQRLVVLPFIMPNDYDARMVAEVSAATMLEQWKAGLDRVIARGEPCFVLDIHQWSASRPDNLEAVRQFIRYAKAKKQCRIVTLREAARRAREFIDHFELPVDPPASTPAALALAHCSGPYRFVTVRRLPLLLVRQQWWPFAASGLSFGRTHSVVN